MASWISGPVAEQLPDAVRCVDPFHVVQLATDALDEIRREVCNEARRAGQTAVAKDLKGARFALWNNSENLTARQQGKLADIQRTNRPFFRAYLLKEQLRQIYAAPRRRGDRAPGPLAEVGARMSSRAISKARHDRHRAARRDRRQRSSTASPTPASRRSTPRSGCSSAAPLASTVPTPFIALAMLSLADLCPPLPR
jgi:hypothetical protein